MSLTAISHWPWRSKVLLIIATLTLSVGAATACGESGELTIQEYAIRFCGAVDEMGRIFERTGDITNGEMINQFDEFLGEVEDLNAPEEVKSYHKYSVESFSYLSEEMHDLDSDDFFTESSLSESSLSPRAVEKFQLLSVQVEDARAEIPPEAIEVLNEAGCAF